MKEGRKEERPKKGEGDAKGLQGGCSPRETFTSIGRFLRFAIPFNDESASSTAV
jgi:hypothetical protein